MTNADETDADETDGKTPIQQAWALAEDPEKIKNYYQKWSDTYDADVAKEDYHGPAIMVALLARQLEILWPQADKQKLQVLDAGCGTGLVGLALIDRGYTNLTGFDLSAEMLQQAELKGCYKELRAGVDLTAPLRPQISMAAKTEGFDVVICVGVLTLGHVPPSGVYQLLEVARPGGVVALNARDVYVKDHNFEYFCEQLEVDGKVRLLYKDYGPSVGDTLGLYVVMQKL